MPEPWLELKVRRNPLSLMSASQDAADAFNIHWLAHNQPTNLSRVGCADEPLLDDVAFVSGLDAGTRVVRQSRIAGVVDATLPQSWLIFSISSVKQYRWMGICKEAVELFGCPCHAQRWSQKNPLGGR